MKKNKKLRNPKVKNKPAKKETEKSEPKQPRRFLHNIFELPKR